MRRRPVKQKHVLQAMAKPLKSGQKFHVYPPHVTPDKKWSLFPYFPAFDDDYRRLELVQLVVHNPRLGRFQVGELFQAIGMVAIVAATALVINVDHEPFLPRHPKKHKQKKAWPMPRSEKNVGTRLAFRS
jgi:hypothetical protein